MRWLQWHLAKVHARGRRRANTVTDMRPRGWDKSWGSKARHSLRLGPASDSLFGVLPCQASVICGDLAGSEVEAGLLCRQ